MAINERLIDTEVAAAGNGGAANEAEQGLILHLDANDVDSYDGDGSVWYDISEYDVTIPLSDNADDLELHLNASDATSYGGTGTTWTDLTSNNNATVSASTYDIDNGGYFDITSNTISFSSNTSALDGTTFSFEMWVYQTTNSGTQYLFSDLGISFFTISGTQMRFIKYLSGTNNDTGYFNPTSNGSGWATNKWNHIAVTFSSYTSSIYINGVLVDAESMGSGTGTALTTLQISPSDGRWKGYLGAFRVYGIALSASEVGQNYRHGRDTVYTDLIDDTNLKLHFDAADLTSASNTTWTDKASSVVLTKSGAVDYDDELGDFIDFGGGYYGNDNTQTPIKDSNGDFSIEFWYNFDAFSGNNVPIGIMQSSSLRGVFVYFDGSTMDVYNYKAGSHSASQFTSQTFSTLGISVGKWYHITHVIDASADIKTYVNGELKATSTSNAGGTPWTSMNGIRIGDMQTISYSNDGKMGQARVYSSLLTQDQIRQNYNFTKNSYPNGYNGTINGASFLPGTSGEVDAFDFNGTNSSVSLNSSAFSQNTYTIAAWFKLDTLNLGAIFEWGDATSYERRALIVWNGNSGNYKLYSSSHSSNVPANTNLATNVWYHGAVTMDNGSASLYLNGQPDGTGTNTLATYTGTTAYVGRTQVGEYLNGKVSEVKVYNRVLTASEIEALYNEG